MSKHTLSHASQILAGDGVAFNLGDSNFGMGDELDNTMRGLRIGVMVVEPIQGGGSDTQLHAANQQPAAGTADQDLLINGTGVVDGVGIQRFCGRVSITSAGVDNGRLFTVLGRDANGRPQAEEITGPNTTTVEGIKHFTKIDRVIVDADTAAVISVGQLETGPRGLRRRALSWPQTFLPRGQMHLAVEGNIVVITGTYDPGNTVTQTAINADQRADYLPIALTEDIEVMYLADLTKEGIGENYTDSRQRVPSAI
jgi:hypothetical protein